MTDNDKAPDLLSNERLLRMAEDDCAVVPRPLCREILRLRDELARAKHWSGADELTLDRNRLLTENATLTAELAKVTAERDLHMEAAHRRLHELHAAQGALPPAIQRAEKAEAERDAARAEVERLNHLTDDGKMAMANVISALTEADKGRTHGSPVERIRDLACERDAAIRDRNEFAAGAAAPVAAEARPDPAPTAPSRWDYVQGACYCRVCKQEADECECEPDRPKPAAKPSTVPVLLHEARSSVALRDNQMALFRLCDAVEALAREVRRD